MNKGTIRTSGAQDALLGLTSAVARLDDTLGTLTVIVADGTDPDVAHGLVGVQAAALEVHAELRSLRNAVAIAAHAEVRRAIAAPSRRRPGRPTTPG